MWRRRLEAADRVTELAPLCGVRARVVEQPARRADRLGGRQQRAHRRQAREHRFGAIAFHHRVRHRAGEGDGVHRDGHVERGLRLRPHSGRMRRDERQRRPAAPRRHDGEPVDRSRVLDRHLVPVEAGEAEKRRGAFHRPRAAGLEQSHGDALLAEVSERGRHVVGERFGGEAQSGAADERRRRQVRTESTCDEAQLDGAEALLCRPRSEPRTPRARSTAGRALRGPPRVPLQARSTRGPAGSQGRRSSTSARRSVRGPCLLLGQCEDAVRDDVALDLLRPAVDARRA